MSDLEPVVAPVADGTEPVEESGSLADHEAQFHQPETAPVDEDARVRDDQGRFVKPDRHRAKSQQATPADVETIAQLTRRIKDAEAAAGADIVQQAGESNRVFELRRRAELAERRRAVAAVPPPTAPPAPPVAVRPPVPPVAEPPAPAIPKKPIAADYPVYEDFIEALGAWTADRRWEANEATRQQQAREAQQRADTQRLAASWATRVEAAKAKYPDFQAKALDAPTRIPAGSAIDLFILEDDESGADVLYHLQTHPDALTALLDKTPLQQLKALTLLSQRLISPPRETAGTTGAASAPVAPPVPRPPTPVRTGPMRPADEPPDPETSSLADHERFFPQKRR